MALRLPRPVVERVARVTFKPLLRAPPRVSRPVLEQLRHLNRVPGGVSVARQTRGGILGDLVAPSRFTGAARILYLHGGGYQICSPATHRNVIATIAMRTGQAVFAPDYRLSPEHPAPAARDDALAAYEGVSADAEGPIAIAGDSAGGGLSLALAQTVRDRGLTPPARLALISPWVDLTLSGASYADNRRGDAMLTIRALERMSRAYASQLAPDDPICSPLRAELAGLPPMLIHAGANEMLLSDAQELARRAEAAGVEVELRVFDDLWHDFHVHTGMLREADEALDELGAFLTQASPARS